MLEKIFAIDIPDKGSYAEYMKALNKFIRKRQLYFENRLTPE